MSAAELKNKILPALLTGMRGRTVPSSIGVVDSLQLVGLTAHALRIDCPQAPESFIVDETAADSRSVVGEEARAAILRIVGAGSTERLHGAVAVALADAGLKLHPFDLPRLETFVQKHASILGQEAMAFAQRDAAPEQRQSYFAVELMNDDNWTHGNRGEKAKFIARRRAEDADAARILLEEAWSSQDVESKVRLVSALRIQASASDVPFLRTLLKERSPRIKDSARSLLARLPGYDGDNPNLREALSRIEPRRGDPSKLDLRLPPSVSHYGASEWIVSTFTGFGVEELAAAKRMSVEELVRAAVPGERLLCGLMVSATNDARIDIISEITERHLPTMEMFLVTNEIPGVENLNAEERIAWLDAALRPRQWTDIPFWFLERLHDILEGPMPPDLARKLLSAPVMRRMLMTTGQVAVEFHEMLAILVPGELRAELLGMIHRDPHAASAVQFIELLHILEN